MHANFPGSAPQLQLYMRHASDQTARNLEARERALDHVRFSSQIHGKKGITWTAHLKVGPLLFEKAATGEVRRGDRLRARAAGDAVENYLEYLRLHQLG
jgi:hypothetical protein